MGVVSTLITFALLGISIAISRWTSQVSPSDEHLVDSSLKTRVIVKIFPFFGLWRRLVLVDAHKLMSEYVRRLAYSYCYLFFLILIFMGKKVFLQN